MATKNHKTKESGSVRIYVEMKPRLKKVRREIARAEDRDVSEIGLINEILEEGLTKRERKLGIEPNQ
jgi:hypothetical protein